MRYNRVSSRVDRLKFIRALVADRAAEAGGQFGAVVNISADFALPAEDLFHGGLLFVNGLKVLGAVAAQGTLIILGQLRALLDESADPAPPADDLSIPRLFLGLRFDLRLIDGIGQGLFRSEYLGVQHFADEQRVAAQIL